MSYTFNTGNSFATLGRLEESVLVSNHSLIIPTDKKWPQFPINHSVIIYTNVLYVYNYYFRKSFKKLSVSINHYLKASKKSKLFLIPVALQTVLLSVLPWPMTNRELIFLMGDKIPVLMPWNRWHCHTRTYIRMILVKIFSKQHLFSK